MQSLNTKPLEMLRGEYLKKNRGSCWDMACVDHRKKGDISLEISWTIVYVLYFIGNFVQKAMPKSSDRMSWQLSSIVYDYSCQKNFFEITQYNADTQHARTLTLSLWAPSKDWASKSWSSRSHHRRFAVDGHVAYHLMHSAGKSWNK